MNTSTTNTMIKSRHIFALLLLLTFMSCTKDKIDPAPISVIHNYLHLSHTRTSTNPNLDSLSGTIDYTKYDMLWLGGDLAQATSMDENTMMHVDSIFDLGNEKTLWTLGNHDYSDLDRIQSFTNRPTYYATYHDGITIVVLDTQKDNSNIIDAQKDFLFNIIDTLDVTSHLVILHHKLIWMYNHPELEEQIPMVSNATVGTCNYCLNPNNFNDEIYNKLVEVKESEIEVICIGGDLGTRSNEFSFLTSEGIHFLASGIEADFDNNQALRFIHDPLNKLLTWQFVLLSEL